MKAALVGTDGTLLHEAMERGACRWPSSRSPRAAATARSTSARAPSPPGSPVPGIVDSEKGVPAVYAGEPGLAVTQPPRAPGPPSPGRGALRLPRPRRNCRTCRGAHRGRARADRFRWGTGIAGAIGIAGSIEAGAHGDAGEIGHIVAPPHGPELRPARLPGDAGLGRRGDRAWAAVFLGDRTGDAGGIRQGRRGRVIRRRSPSWRDAIDALAAGLVTALTLLDPGTLIIGGGLAEAGETLFTPLRAAVEERVTFQPPHIVPAALGDTARDRRARGCSPGI
ncbi:ROK family protein [Streptomyces californicus]